jgi:hypothetical protein
MTRATIEVRHGPYCSLLSAMGHRIVADPALRGCDQNCDRKLNRPNCSEHRMKWSSAKISLATTCLMGLAACADLDSIRLQLDELKSQVGKLQNDTSRATAAANAASANASSAVARAQRAVSQVQSETRANAIAIAALDDKIDRMFRRPLSKRSATGQAANTEPM